MRKLAMVLAGLLLVPALAFAGGGGDVQATAVGEQRITVLSGGKTVATLTLSRGAGDRIEYRADAVRAEYDAAKRTTRLSGKVSLKLIRDGRQVMLITADEAIFEPTQAPAQQTPSK